ncbi:hypothetical protein NW768_001072 [Fusarium equiseti]|uniref:HNH nuclease domain-containing protein n=1 Tax=Fusarium equiseti TaxID=61235 RepID=A0ABQ8RQ36_FUSEQ|nr:hypothetical protein NW768_001072 [Fusarium equiseti]
MDSSTSRTISAQGRFETEMTSAYSPNSPCSTKQWDPVLRTWRQSKAVQLFPPQHASKADAIFGRGAANEIYSPHNGLFLHEKVEHALKKGYIAIVPDGRTNYKVVVLDKQRREVHRRIGRSDVDGFKRYIDLDERPLRFKTDARPKVRYVWWAYVSAVLQTFYWADSPSDYGKINHLSEVRWLDSYWKYRGPFVKRNQLDWFMYPDTGPCWTAAYLHGFEEEGDMSNSGLDLQRIFSNEHWERQQSPVPDYEEVDSGDEEATRGRGRNGEESSGINNTAVSAAGIALLQRSVASLRASSPSIYPSRTIAPPPPYSFNPHPPHPLAPPPPYSSRPPPPPP